MVKQNILGFRTESRESLTEKNVTWNKANNSAPVYSPQEDVHTLNKSVKGKVRTELYSVMATVDTRKHDAFSTAMES